MKIIDKARFNVLLKQKRIFSEDYYHIDDLRIGLSLKQRLIRAPNEIISEISHPEKYEWQEIDLKNDPLLKGEFYLGFTKEKFSFDGSVFGLIHCRSKYARLGLDCLQSSTYISPYFGYDKALPIVLEIAPKISLSLSNEYIAFITLFEIDEPISNPDFNYHSLFPLNLYN